MFVLLKLCARANSRQQYKSRSARKLCSDTLINPLRTVALIASAHIFCASRVRPARSRDSYMCSGAKNFRCQWVVVFVFRFRCGSVDLQMGNVKPKRNGRFVKKSGPSKRKRLHDEKQTSTLAPDNKWNKESSAGGTKLTCREGRRIVELGVFAEQVCFSEDIWKATIWKDHVNVNLSVKFSSTSLQLPRYCKLRIW